MSAVGLGRMLRIQVSTNRRALVLWIVLLVLAMVGTAALIAGLYDTPDKIHTYAAAVTTGDALVAVNGRVEGIDSLGGVIQDEFGFVATIVMPLLGISLVSRGTRREEEAGRLETVLAGRVGRHVPTLAALTIAAAAILLTAIGFAIGLLAEGVPESGAVLYGASLGATAFVFAGLAALAAQFTRHTRDVYTWTLLLLLISYVLRGIGDVTGTWITWLSPLGWAERTAPFGAHRWWPLFIPMLVGAVCAAAALWLSARRDLGSALITSSAGPAHASSTLRTATGLAAWIHRPGLLGFLAGVLLFAAMMGSLAQQLVDAATGNPALADAIGITTSHPEDGFLAMTLLYLAIIGTGYLVQAVASLRAEETTGRLETRLAGALSRRSWMTGQAVVITAGLLVINLAGSSVLAATSAWSLGTAVQIPHVIVAGAAYLAPELVVGGFAIACFGALPSAFPLAWAVFGATTFIALFGAGLQLPGWMLDLAPTTHVGSPPSGSAHGVAFVLLTAVAIAMTTVALTGFRRRDISHP